MTEEAHAVCRTGPGLGGVPVWLGGGSGGVGGEVRASFVMRKLTKIVRNKQAF